MQLRIRKRDHFLLDRPRVILLLGFRKSDIVTFRLAGRGKTRFEKEMKKDRVKHIRSRPHHPMTLGKIERFWKSIQSEFLFRPQFDSFEQAMERTVYLVKYYNYMRPHQGIGGLCPADRFFEIQHDLKRTLAKGVEENSLELALRGRPIDPFYMVGRMGVQWVVIRAEKGKVRMLIDGMDPMFSLCYVGAGNMYLCSSKQFLGGHHLGILTSSSS